MKPYANDRPDKPIPGNDVSTLDLEACKATSKGCPFCRGEGFADIFNPRYAGQVIEFDASDLSREPKRTLMRSVCYCSCNLGRKIMSMHRTDAKDIYERTPDIYDVADNRYPAWQLDDPSQRDLTEAETAALPKNYRDLMIRRVNASL